MAQATLNAAVVLGGRVDNSFTQIGDALLNMSMTVDGISRELINFGKESVNVYRDYQDSMLDAEVALSTTYGRGTRELKAVMMELDTQATEWAASTIFHTDDVANAISEAAHANWDLDKILTGIPAAMRMAQAGSMDLSQSMEYIIKTANAAQIPFEEMPTFIDQWVYAANSSAATVDQLGDAMLRMGATMRFAGGEEELLTLLSALHDGGASGAEAGTMLRNSLIRLIAPTDKAATALAFLGVSEDEVNQAMSETKGNAKKAAQLLKDLGFSAYDQKGNLKSFTDIFTDLALVTDKMNDQERNDVLSAIFPTRTITAALTLLNSAKNNWNGLLDALNGGSAEGYGAYGAETMMSGLTGSIETFNSKMERLKQLTGKSLEGDVSGFLSVAGNFIDSIANLDEPSFNMLVSGLEGIALAGPGMAAAGWAFRFLGQALGTHTGRIALAATALFALGKAAQSVYDYDYKQSFGDLTFDDASIAQIKEHLDQVSQPFLEARKALDGYKASMEAAVTAYTDKSSELAQGIITKMVTGAALTEEEEKSFISMGESIIKNLEAGMKNGYEARVQSLFQTYGKEGEAFDNPIFGEIMLILDEDFQNATERAAALSQQLRDAMTSAFKDDKLTPEETENIQNILKEMNKELAIQTNAAMYADQLRMFDRGQSLGLEGIEQLKTETNQAMEKVLGLRKEEFFQDYGYLKASLERRRGTYDKENHLIDQTYIDAMLYDLEVEQKKEEYRIRAEYEKMLVRGYNNMVNTSEFADVADFMGGIADAARSGGVDAEALMEQVARTKYAKGSNGQYIRYLNEMINAMGGETVMTGLINQWEKSGDAEMAAMAQRQLDILRLYNGNYGSFAGRYNMEQEPKSWSEKEAEAKGVIESLYTGAKEKAKETKEEIDEVLNPTEMTIEFPDAAEAAKAWGADFQSNLPTSYMNVVTQPSGNGVSASAGGEKSSGGIIGWFKGLLGYAEGGRSEVPAIFGEGPTAEWAIPEAHTMRTASLLTAAAEASGFSWPELASTSEASGGGNLTIYYSPVVHADNAQGVEAVLKRSAEDMRKELDRWWADKKLQESVAAYS